ncbi:MAG: LD-carboxypeptidase [Lachnospiraceae bacterium]|nr:LD-carboxypeptidase [Lachnospiraceae bacterium]
MRYPGFLKKNGTIGYVAPAFGCADEVREKCLDHAREVFRQMGYGEKLGPNCYLAEGIGISSTPESCAAELEEGYLDPESQILLSCGGGELMCETVSLVDFEKIKKAEPKWFMGYSDNTNFTLLLATICDTASVYGPCAKAFGMEPWHRSVTDAYQILTGETKTVEGYDRWEKEDPPEGSDHPLAPYYLTEDKVLKIWLPENDTNETMKNGLWIPDARKTDREISISGRLLGGCMDCLATILGTRLDKVKEFADKYEEDGILWFLEACDLNVFSIRRAMWQMEEAGWFRNVTGFLIGRPLCYGQEMMGLDAYEAVLAVARRHKVPVIMDADLGHLPPAMPIVCGSIGTIEVKGNHIQIQYEYR